MNYRIFSNQGKFTAESAEDAAQIALNGLAHDGGGQFDGLTETEFREAVSAMPPGKVRAFHHDGAVATPSVQVGRAPTKKPVTPQVPPLAGMTPLGL